MQRFVLAAGIALALTATAALADDRRTPEGNAETVRFTDLDLSRPNDAATLFARLQLASARACEAPELTRPSPAARRMMQTCREDALQTSVARVNHPQLARIYAASRR